MERHELLEEIRRIASENGGRAPGKKAFALETGVTESQWSGRYWVRWSDALAEAGFEPNQMQNKVRTDEELIELLAEATRELGHFPTAAELKLWCRRADRPSPNTFARLGSKAERVEAVHRAATADTTWADVLDLLPPPQPSVPNGAPPGVTPPEVGFVYLAKSGRFHKIGLSRHVGRRSYELALQLPERLEIVHTIRTDDPEGVEHYWHERFAHLRANGEWFKLGRAEVAAFRRWPDLA